MHMPESPPHVVSLSPAASEVLLDLGAGRTVIAVDAESSSLAGLGELPVVDLAASVDLAPDLVVVPAFHDDDGPIADQLREGGSDVIEFAPHDFDDAYRLCHMLGLRLGRVKEARAYVADHSRDLAVMSAASFGDRRPRVAAVVGWSTLRRGGGQGSAADRIELAGGHSFATDLVEIAGAESVTHGNGDYRVSMSPARLLATAPDLVLVTSSVPISEAERLELAEMLRDAPEVGFITFDPEKFWPRSAVSVARQMRSLVQPLVRGRLPGLQSGDATRVDPHSPP